MKSICLLLFLTAFLSFGQDRKEQMQIDSIKRVISLAKNDTNVINALRDWDNIIYRYDSDLDLKLNLRIDSIATAQLKKKQSSEEKEYYLKAKGFSCTNLGLIYNAKGENNIALDYLNASLEAKKRINDQKGIARTLNNIGSIYHEQGVYDKAVQFYMDALKIHEKLDNRRGIGGALNNLAIIHRYEGNYETALEYYERSLLLKEEDKDSSAIAVAHLNLATLFIEMRSFQKARQSVMKCLEISQKSGNERNTALAYVNLGSIYYEQKQLRDALTYFTKGFEIQKAIDDKKKVAETSVYLAKVYADLGNNTNAIKYGEKALELSYSSDVAKVTEEASRFLYQLYTKTGSYQKALKMLEINVEINKKINNDESKKAVIRQEFMYQYQKKAATDSIRAAEADKLQNARLAAEIAKRRQHELKAYQQEQQKYFLFGGLALTLLFAAFLYNRFRVTQKQRDIIEIQKKKVDEEKKKSDELLLNILPEEFAEELKREGKATPTNFEQVTVLFTDFQGFTRIAAEMTPRDLVETLNECFTAFDKIIEKHNMEKIKTIGDAYMCAGGVPIKNNTNPVDAVLAASEMLQWVNAWNIQRQLTGLQTWEIRIGIHTGELIAGVIGFKKFAFDVWGDAVNVASRIESAGEVGKINISASTQSYIQDHFETEFRGEIEVKNRGAIGMYFVRVEGETD